MFTERLPDAQRIALVGCAATKLKHAAPARALYTSGLFRAALAYAETTCDAVVIVSAFRGAVAPNEVIGPYDRSLRELSKRERAIWGARTIRHIRMAFRVPPQLVILAGRLYADALAYGAHHHDLPRPEEPLRGIAGCGRASRGSTPTRARPAPLRRGAR
jgi:hypothetical protein